MCIKEVDGEGGIQWGHFMSVEIVIIDAILFRYILKLFLFSCTQWVEGEGRRGRGNVDGASKFSVVWHKKGKFFIF